MIKRDYVGEVKMKESEVRIAGMVNQLATAWKCKGSFLDSLGKQFQKRVKKALEYNEKQTKTKR